MKPKLFQIRSQRHMVYIGYEIEHDKASPMAGVVRKTVWKAFAYQRYHKWSSTRVREPEEDTLGDPEEILDERGLQTLFKLIFYYGENEWLPGMAKSNQF